MTTPHCCPEYATLIDESNRLLEEIGEENISSRWTDVINEEGFVEAKKLMDGDRLVQVRLKIYEHDCPLAQEAV